MVSGGEDHQIIIWAMTGTIIKTLKFFGSPISNLVVLARPVEYTKEDQLIKKKKLVGFQPFGKYQKEGEKRVESGILTRPAGQKTSEVDEWLKYQLNGVCFEQVLLDELRRGDNSVLPLGLRMLMCVG